MKIYNNVQTPGIASKGVLDGTITTALRTLDKNPMVNAVGIDLVAMVGPRTYVDTKERNKYAGAETFFREFTGTLTVCLSASYFAKWIAAWINNVIAKKNKINPNSWFSNSSIEFLKEANIGAKNTKDFVKNIVNTIPNLKEPDEWIDEKNWFEYKWDNEKYKNIHQKITNKDSLINILTEIIEDKELSLSDKDKLLKILNLRTINMINTDNVNLKINNTEHSTSVFNLLRDTVDIGRDVFSKTIAEQDILLKKLVRINKVKSIGALSLASILGLANQYINRKITEKRTGTKGFVGDINYKDRVENKESYKDKTFKFRMEKVMASLGMVAMAIAVMGIKSPKDFVKKLEFIGPVNSGNVIKTVYASTLVGRFLASDNKDELRETVTRDYFGFLNWLVLGGFTAKGVANILDPKRKNLFNGNVNGKGIKNWLNNISLKSHNEIAVNGKSFARENMWKLNIAQVSGLAYSIIALGILLPKLNIWLTNKKQNKSKTLSK